VLGVLVQRLAPPHLLRRRIDLDAPAQFADVPQHVSRHLTHRTVGRKRDRPLTTVAVLNQDVVRSQIERYD